MPGTIRLQRQGLVLNFPVKSCCKRNGCTMYLQGSNPALLCTIQPAACAASDTTLEKCSMCLQAHTSTTTAKKRRPTRASSHMGKLRPQQLKWLMRMGTRMGHRRPQVGWVCLGCLSWQAWLAGQLLPV